MSSALVKKVLAMLADDLVSHGFLVQILRDEYGVRNPDRNKLAEVLRQLLQTKEIEIGNTELVDGDYVSFKAWSGSVDERVDRALRALEEARGDDKLFAYWLGLTSNVDTFEKDVNLPGPAAAEQMDEREPE